MVRVSSLYLPEHAAALDSTVRTGGSRPVSIVFVCTANRCRSPLAEQLARRESVRRGVATSVTSVGLLPGGLPTPDVGVRAAAEYGLDLAAHRSRQRDRARLGEADLILTMTRAHARELVAEQPDLWPRVFPLKQFAAYSAEYPPPRRAHLGSWIAGSAEVRSPRDLMGDNPAHGVHDPMGEPIAVWRRTIRELDGLVEGIFSHCAAALPLAARSGR